MIDAIWSPLGIARWPLAFSFVAVLILALWSAFKLFRSGAKPDLVTKAWLDAILFWGGFAVISGVLGTLIGIIIAVQSIEAMGGATTMVWGGVKVAILSSWFGVMILASAALLWFVLQLRWRLLVAKKVDATP